MAKLIRVDADVFAALVQQAHNPCITADDAGVPDPMQYLTIYGRTYGTPLRGVA